MKVGVVVILLWIVSSSFSGRETAKMVEWSYIERFAPLAVDEMLRVGIPASVKLAQAVVESNAGRSTLATQSNNHFGIKCKTYWKGRSYYHRDDDLDDKGKLIESCFRAYSDIESSFIDHSNFLRGSPNYGRLFLLDPTDYKGWTSGLSTCGYATDKAYSDKLLRIIETYQLYRYDTYHAPVFDFPADKGRSWNAEATETTRD